MLKNLLTPRVGYWAHQLGTTQLEFHQDLHEKTTPLSMFKNLKLASFAQLQFNSMNICLFSLKLAILLKICPTLIEIVTFSKWSLKVYRFQKRAFLLKVHGVN